MLSGFHARFLGLSFDAYRVIFTGTGLLAVAGGIYTRVHLRGLMDVGKATGSDTAATDGQTAVPLGTDLT